MPSYMYVCPNCGHAIEEAHSITVDPVIECGLCSQATMVRKPQGYSLSIKYSMRG